MRGLIVLLAGGWLSLTAGAGGAQSPAPDVVEGMIAVPEQAQPIMPLSEIEPGMTGYGMTIFRGTTIETFPIEVATVLPDNNGPRMSTVWIRSSDPRLQESSGAQGMSGSPIYLWPDDLPEDQRVLGENGRLIGAFAYVYADTIGMLAGVQPIEYMRGVADRMSDDHTRDPAADAARSTGGATASAMVARLAEQLAANHAHAPRLDAIARLTRDWRPTDPSRDAANPAAPRDAATTLRPRPLGIALDLGSAADTVAPLLAGTGFGVMQAGGASGALARVPRDVDADARLQPGSVLAVPLSFGDLTLAGHGTVTDILPDGRVLGFGHSMMGAGDAALPVATGFAHFIVPRSVISFRLATPLRTAGTMLRDENTAVAATHARAFRTSPMTVRTAVPKQAPAEYAYDVVHHPTLTPIIVAILGIESLAVDQSPPLRSTVYVNGELRFSGDRTIPVRTMVPDGGVGGIVAATLPTVATLLDNPFERLTFEGADLDIRVEPRLRSARILDAALDRSVAAPGQTVTLTTTLVSPVDGRYTIEQHITVPEDAADGEAEVMVGGLTAFAYRHQLTEPYRYRTASIDDLTQVLAGLAQMPDNALYVSTIWSPGESLAIGRTALPDLPSSRRALLGTMSHSLATPYPRSTSQRQTLDDVPVGERRLYLTVRDPDAAN